MSKFLIYLKIASENNLLLVLVFICFRLFRSKRLFTCTIGGAKLKIRAHGPDLKVARQCLIEREFGCVEKIIAGREVAFIIDGGGYIGTAAIAFARMFPNATLVTVEPFKDNFEILRQNVSGFANIIPVHGALVGWNREVTLHDRGTGAWGFTIEPAVKGADLPGVHKIGGVSVESLMQRFEATRLDIVKLDIEGAEKEVLENANAWLPDTQIVVAELHDRIVPGCSQVFEQATMGMEIRKMAGEKIFAVRNFD